MKVSNRIRTNAMSVILANLYFSGGFWSLMREYVFMERFRHLEF